MEQDSPVATVITTGVDVNVGLNDTSCAVLANGTAKCWGYNLDGEVGDGTNTNRKNPQAVKNLTNVAAITLGNIHVCAVLTTGAVWCWGDDTYGELGDGQTNTTSNVPVQANTSGAIAIAAGGDGFSEAHTCVLTGGGAVQCWGSNDYGQLGDGTNNASLTPVTAISSGAVAIAAGTQHTCALMGSGKVMCWGYNGDGELGDGTTTDSSVPVQVQGF